MARVLFELSSGIDGTIELRDCEFVDHWKEVFLQNNNNVGVRPPSDVGQKYAAAYFYEKEVHKVTTVGKYKRTEEQAIEMIRLGIADLEKYPLPWTRGEPYTGMGWDITNNLHRGFTTLNLTQCTDRIDLTHEEKNELMVDRHCFSNGSVGRRLLMGYDKSGRWNRTEDWYHEIWSKWTNDEFMRFFSDVHQINSGVHNVEWCRVSKRELLVNAMVFPGEFANIPRLDWNSKAADKITDAIRVDKFVGGVAKDAVDNDPHWNVYDLKNILGKDYLTAWKNYDDPGEWDICNHYQTTKGGFEILPHMHFVVNRILVPWITDDWGYQAWPEIVSPIQIGHMDEREMKEICTPSETNGNDISKNQIVKVDLI